MSDLESLVRLLVRGGASLAESASAEARRVVEELVSRGDLRDAARAQARWLDERVMAPVRTALHGAAEAVGRAAAGVAAPSDEIGARLAALEERLARIERLLSRRDGED